MSDTILWRRRDLPGHESGRLQTFGDGWEQSGTARFHYEVPAAPDLLLSGKP